MSQENVEAVRRAFEAAQRGEPSDVLHADVEWDSSAYPGVAIEARGMGRENYRRLMGRYGRAWLGYEVTLKELIDAGDDVVVVFHETARARGTLLLIDRDLFNVVTLRAGKAIRLRWYQTRREALEAVGLRE